MIVELQGMATRKKFIRTQRTENKKKNYTKTTINVLVFLKCHFPFQIFSICWLLYIEHRHFLFSSSLLLFVVVALNSFLFLYSFYHFTNVNVLHLAFLLLLSFHVWHFMIFICVWDNTQWLINSFLPIRILLYALVK